MSTSTENTVSLKKLRRLAMRAKSTLEVHSQHPTIALHLSTLPEAADRFMRADDATTTQEALRVAVGKRGYPAVDELRRFMRSYVGVLSRDLPESEAVRLFAHATVSDDVLVQASQLSERFAAVPRNCDRVASNACRSVAGAARSRRPER